MDNPRKTWKHNNNVNLFNYKLKSQSGHVRYIYTACKIIHIL